MTEHSPARWSKAWAGDRATQYARLMRLDRPIGILLLLWPTLWSLWFAEKGMPNWHVLLVFVAGVVLMRSAGCVINDFADRKIDPHVERTQQRPMAAGLVSAKEALGLFTVLCLVAFALVLTTNTLTVYYSLAAVVLAALYPFTKRFFPIPQLFLGAAFSMAIPMSFAAINNHVPLLAWLLFTANLVWTVAYDTEYAMTDREDDLKIGVRSSAIFFGETDVLMTLSLHGLFLIGMGFAAAQFAVQTPYFYYAGLLAALALMIYQYKLIKDRNGAQCFKAFLNNNYVGLCVFLGAAVQFFMV